MNKISSIFIFLIYIALFSFSYSNSIMTPEGVKIGILATDLKALEILRAGKPLDTWADLASVYDGDLTRIEISQVKGEGFTELYSLVPLHEGLKFPEGILICIRFKPTAWPSVWSDDLNKKEKDEGDLNREKPIRYLVYKNQRGDILSTWWYEEKIQAMLAKTGLTIPPPTPYYPPTHTPPGEKQVDPSLPVTSVATMKASPSVTHMASSAPAPVAPPPTKSANPVWWIIGVIAVLTAVLVLARKKKPIA
jgi:hypothetical protein